MLDSLITGGGGFIGSHLSERLLEEGCRVTVVDDFSTGRRANVSHLLSNDRFRLIEGSVLDDTLMDGLIGGAARVFHLASAVGVRLVMEEPVKTIETIFNGTEVVLRYCARYHKQVIIASSSEVYGKGASVPFVEDDDTLSGATVRHRWAYACAKALDEFLALAHWRQNQLPVSIVRLFNTVGPRQIGRYGMVVPRLIHAALNDEPLVVYGDGGQTRCFAHVLDVVDGLVRVSRHSGCLGKVINLGTNHEISINALAELIIRVTASKSVIQHVPYETVYGDGFEDMRRRVPCLKRAAQLAGYRPKRDLHDVIRDVAADLRGSWSPILQSADVQLGATAP